ncbi:MAG: hypothetical protein HC896_14345 [Bacteroidales bacterium]|nr:hypothetical protein [Bacteroidales bacterium]
MANISLQALDLESLKNNEQIIKDTAAQIIKDFGMFGVEIQFSGDTATAYDELFNKLQPIINKLINEQGFKFKSLLYQIDVNSKKVFTSNVFHLDALTHEILQREFKKVCTRWYFKHNPQ